MDYETNQDDSNAFSKRAISLERGGIPGLTPGYANCSLTKEKKVVSLQHHECKCLDSLVFSDKESKPKALLSQHLCASLQILFGYEPVICQARYKV